jgi:hypothetical protein
MKEFEEALNADRTFYATNRNSYYIIFLIKSMAIKKKYLDRSSKPLCKLCIYTASDSQQTQKCCRGR